ALDPTMLPIIYEAPEGADWTDERVWQQANPALGDFRSLEEMRIAAARAQEIPAQENTFRRLYLNQWTEQATRWMAMPAWDACLAPRDRATLAGRPCYVGLDLSSTQDLTALVGVLPDADGFDVVAQFFVPAESIRLRSNRARVPYDQWAREGWLVATPGASVKYEYVRQELQAWDAAFDVQVVDYDPWNAHHLLRTLHAQDGFRAPTPRHTGHPVLRWNIANAATETDAAGNLKLSKKASTEKIDGAVALVMAVDGMDRHPRPPSYQMYVFGGPA